MFNFVGNSYGRHRRKGEARRRQERRGEEGRGYEFLNKGYEANKLIQLLERKVAQHRACYLPYSFVQNVYPLWVPAPVVLDHSSQYVIAAT